MRIGLRDRKRFAGELFTNKLCPGCRCYLILIILSKENVSEEL